MSSYFISCSGLRVLLKRALERAQETVPVLFCAMAGLGGERAFLLIHSQQGFLPAPVLSSQDPDAAAGTGQL